MENTQHGTKDRKSRNKHSNGSYKCGRRNYHAQRHTPSYAPPDRYNKNSSEFYHAQWAQYSPKNVFMQHKELANPVPLDTPFYEIKMRMGFELDVCVTWTNSPASFYVQILDLQSEFLKMMQSIPGLYKGVRPFSGFISVGASVLARCPVDGVLYRATVLEVRHDYNYIVQNVDCGNIFLVGTKDIWQLDKILLKLPKMALHCSLLGVAPIDGEWKKNIEIDLCFNKPKYQCTIFEYLNGLHKVSLCNKRINVADMLIEKFLANPPQTSGLILRDDAVDMRFIKGQQMLCRVTHVESWDKFYIQVNLEKAAGLEAILANFDVSMLEPLPADDLCKDTDCVVYYGDKIYRAKLVDVVDPTKVIAILPDYGNTITVPADYLMDLPDNLFYYCYQSAECRFNNFTTESKKLMTLDQLKETLTGKKFIVYINDIEKRPESYAPNYVTTFYDVSSGKKVAIFEPDEGAYDEVVQMCTNAVFDYGTGKAYLAPVDDIFDMYLQKSTAIDGIKTMLNELTTLYEQGKDNCNSYDLNVSADSIETLIGNAPLYENFNSLYEDLDLNVSADSTENLIGNASLYENFDSSYEDLDLNVSADSTETLIGNAPLYENFDSSYEDLDLKVSADSTENLIGNASLYENSDSSYEDLNVSADSIETLIGNAPFYENFYTSYEDLDPNVSADSTEILIGNAPLYENSDSSYEDLDLNVSADSTENLIGNASLYENSDSSYEDLNVSADSIETLIGNAPFYENFYTSYEDLDPNVSADSTEILIGNAPLYENSDSSYEDLDLNVSADSTENLIGNASLYENSDSSYEDLNVSADSIETLIGNAPFYENFYSSYEDLDPNVSADSTEILIGNAPLYENSDSSYEDLDLNVSADSTEILIGNAPLYENSDSSYEDLDPNVSADSTETLIGNAPLYENSYSSYENLDLNVSADSTEILIGNAPLYENSYSSYEDLYDYID